ncbi:MAG: hypothetical protein Q9164_002644 [Protoblastenia rupestris]
MVSGHKVIATNIVDTKWLKMPSTATVFTNRDIGDKSSSPPHFPLLPPTLNHPPRATSIQRAMSSSHQDPIASHGRGGAGNIAPDSNTYVDGEIVREGPTGDQGDGAYSSGRGGAGNINSPGLKATHKQPGDSDVIPETAVRRSGDYENYHVGRGGQGNVHKEHEGQHRGVMDKVKEKLQGKKDGA